MNEKEAIIIINRFKGITTAPVNTEEVREACALAIAALNKQVPRKLEVEGADEQDDYFCPSCNTSLCTIGDSVYWGVKPKYCDECGQALDWE